MHTINHVGEAYIMYKLIFFLLITKLLSCQKQSFAYVLQNRCSLKFRKFYRKTPVLESLFNKIAAAALSKRDSNTGIFL